MRRSGIEPARSVFDDHGGHATETIRIANIQFQVARWQDIESRAHANTLTLHGRLDYNGGDKLGKRVDSPYKETTTIADGKATIEREGRGAKTFGLDRAPDLQGLLASFSALLSGDSATMNRYYAIDETIDEKHWTLTLRPRSDALAKHLKTVVIDGAEKEPRCFTMVQADGDASVMLLGDLAKATLPTPLTRESLDSLCRRPAQ